MPENFKLSQFRPKRKRGWMAEESIERLYTPHIVGIVIFDILSR